MQQLSKEMFCQSTLMDSCFCAVAEKIQGSAKLGFVLLKQKGMSKQNTDFTDK